MSTVIECRPVSSRLITIVQAYAPASENDDNEKKNSMTSYRMPLIRLRRRTFFLCKKTEMQKWARMLVETGKAFEDLSAKKTQMREVSDFWSLPPLTILCWQTHFAITKHSEDGPGIFEMDNYTTRLITFS